MEKKFKNIIRNNINLTYTEPVIIAFSGGIDSICLLNLFSKTTNPIIVAHFNHGIRENADRDEEFSRNFAQQFNYEFVSAKEDVGTFARKNHLSIEEAARQKRYEFLFRIARKKGADKIAVGHHADDQVETVMMHFLRGSGLSGLSGMKEEAIIPEFDPKISIIRPLLSFWREEIKNYCDHNHLEYVVDETNLNDIYERNRIRLKILPFLNNLYPGLNSRIFNMANIIQNDDELIQKQIQISWDSCCILENHQFIQFEKLEFQKLSISIQRRIIRNAVDKINPEIRDLSYQNVENLLQFLNQNKPGEIDLQQNVIAVIGNNTLTLGSRFKEWIDIIYPQLNDTIKFDIKLDKLIRISSNWIFQINNWINTESIPMNKDNKYIVFLDADSFGNENIILRSRKDGDRFQPLGMDKGSIKISDFFINEKLEKSARDKWPLLVNSSEEIIWIPGFKPGNKFRIKKSTSRVIQFSISKTDD